MSVSVDYGADHLSKQRTWLFSFLEVKTWVLEKMCSGKVLGRL